MSRPARGARGQTLAARFAADPVETVVALLRHAGSPMRAQEIMARLTDGGVPDVRRAWGRVQPKVRSHDHVEFTDLTYSWTERLPSPVEALELLAGSVLPTTRRRELVDVVRVALADGGGVDLEERARRRQAEIDAARALAELAAEVEELAVNEARTEAMIHRVRARANRSDLEPIDRAGDETTFDRKRHKPISGSISDGAPVIVVRPGYVWKAPTEDVLVAKAIVEE